MRKPSRRPGLARPGESQPQRLDWLTMIKAYPAIVRSGALATVVPPSHATFGADGAASVTCTCGSDLPLSVAPAASAGCICGRLFVNIGGEVRVSRDDAEVPA